jgi:hypothetical protein
MTTAAEKRAAAILQEEYDRVKGRITGLTAEEKAAVIALTAGDFVTKDTLHANTILKADVDHTPIELAISASNFVGRKAAGAIVSLSASDARTILGLATTDSPVLVTIKLSGLDALRVPYHVDDATGLADSPVTVAGGHFRYTTAINSRYYHLPLASANPGASGPTWVAAGTNTTGGWRLDAATEILRGQVDLHDDWDGATNPVFKVHFMVNVNNTGGGVGDTVDLKCIFRYKGEGDTVVKTQTVEVATTVGQSAQYKQFAVQFPLDWDYASNVLEVGDLVSVNLNLETDTSEVDDIVVTGMGFYYATTHIGIESGDT